MTRCLAPSEVVAVVAFLEVHAPEEFAAHLSACNRAIEREIDEIERRADRSLLLFELVNRYEPDGTPLISGPAQKYLARQKCVTLGDVETLFFASDDKLRRACPRLATKKALRQIRIVLKTYGLNH